MDILKKIDGLRIIACLVVVMLHVGASSIFNVHYLPIFSSLFNGKIAVGVFFAISGYLFSYLMYKSNYSIKYAIIMMLKRPLRLILPMIVSILFAVFLYHHNLLIGQYDLPLPSYTYLASIKDTFLILYNNTVPVIKYNGVLWTIMYETTGVYVVMLLTIICQKYFKVWLGLIVILFIMSKVFSMFRVDYAMKFLPMLLGHLFFIFYNKRAYKLYNFQQKTSYTYGILLIMIILKFKYTGYSYDNLVYVAIMTFLIFELLHTNKYSSFLLNKKLVALSKYTFSIYVIHYPLMYLKFMNTL